MFEIWGTLNGVNKEKDERLSAYFTNIITAESEKPLFVPPFFKLWKERIENEPVSILTFRNVRHENSPYVTANQLKLALHEFSPLKEKILVALPTESCDFNLRKGISVPLTLNIANFKAAAKCCKIFFDESIGSSYFTYMSKNSPHLVWVEDTKALAYKHNIIKEAGFRGIYWDNPYLLLEGNWEALTSVYKKRTSR